MVLELLDGLLPGDGTGGGGQGELNGGKGDDLGFHVPKPGKLTPLLAPLDFTARMEPLVPRRSIHPADFPSEQRLDAVPVVDAGVGGVIEVDVDQGGQPGIPPRPPDGLSEGAISSGAWSSAAAVFSTSSLR